MPACLRIEIFPADQQRCVDFYTKVMRFTLAGQKGLYSHFKRDSISLAADSHFLEGNLPSKKAEMLDAKAEYRRPPTGVEVVIEVDDLEKERDLIVQAGWKLDADIKEQFWGLRDFRIVDPDGYYLRITEHGGTEDSTM